jgi:hypothetical protein
MTPHWLDVLARRMATRTNRRQFLQQTSTAAIVAAGGVALAGRHPPVASGRSPATTSPSSCCRYLCTGSPAGRAPLGHSSHFVWVSPADPCPTLAHCEWLQRIDLAEL